VRAVGVHIFAGSFTVGIQRAGFDVVAAYEDLGLGLQTARENFDFPIIYPKEKWSSHVPKNISLVYANPPCSAFSRMGLNRGSSDPINTCMFECAELAIRLDPTIFIMESVPGLWTHGQDIIQKLNSRFVDYQHTYLFSDSVLHGSPQIRPRFHYIASKYDFQIAKFNPYPVPTIRDAIWNLRLTPQSEELNHVSTKVSGQLESLIEHIPPGITASEIWRSFPNFRDSYYGQPFGPTRRGAWDGPGPTITGGPTIIHPEYDRFITIREAARIFGYPDSFHFLGNISNQYAQIGKAVTCFMGEFLGRSARRTIASETEPTQREQFIDLLPYTEEAVKVQKLAWYGSQERGTKRKLLENYIG